MNEQIDFLRQLSEKCVFRIVSGNRSMLPWYMGLMLLQYIISLDTIPHHCITFSSIVPCFKKYLKTFM